MDSWKQLFSALAYLLLLCLVSQMLMLHKGINASVLVEHKLWFGYIPESVGGETGGGGVEGWGGVVGFEEVEFELSLEVELPESTVQKHDTTSIRIACMHTQR